MPSYLGWLNRIDSATLSGGSWEAALPLTAIQDLVLAHKARSTDAALTSTQLTVTWVSPIMISLVALAAHNASEAAQWRMTLKYDGVQIYQSAWLYVWPAAFDVGDVEWEWDSFWNLTWPSEERSRWTALAVHRIGDLSADTITVEVDDTTNLDGYFEAGRLFAGRADQIDATNPLAIGFEHDSQSVYSLGGQCYTDARALRRVAEVRADYLSHDDALRYGMDIPIASGVDGEVILMIDDADSRNLLRQTMLGRLREPHPLEYVAYGRTSAAWTVEESL